MNSVYSRDALTCPPCSRGKRIPTVGDTVKNSYSRDELYRVRIQGILNWGGHSKNERLYGSAGVEWSLHTSQTVTYNPSQTGDAARLRIHDRDLYRFVSGRDRKRHGRGYEPGQLNTSPVRGEVPCVRGG